MTTRAPLFAGTDQSEQSPIHLALTLNVRSHSLFINTCFIVQCSYICTYGIFFKANFTSHQYIEGSKKTYDDVQNCLVCQIWSFNSDDERVWGNQTLHIMIAVVFSNKMKEVTNGIFEDKTLVRTCLNIQIFSQQIYIFLKEKLHESSSLVFCCIFNQWGLKLFKSEKKSHCSHRIPKIIEVNSPFQHRAINSRSILAWRGF